MADSAGSPDATEKPPSLMDKLRAYTNEEWDEVAGLFTYGLNRLE